jgi:hypothetical protein
MHIDTLIYIYIYIYIYCVVCLRVQGRAGRIRMVGGRAAPWRFWPFICLLWQASAWWESGGEGGSPIHIVMRYEEQGERGREGEGGVSSAERLPPSSISVHVSHSSFTHPQ